MCQVWDSPSGLFEVDGCCSTKALGIARDHLSFFTTRDGRNQECGAHAGFLWVPYVSTRLVAHPYVRIRSLARMYKHATGMQALFYACVWSTMILVHTGVRTIQV